MSLRRETVDEESVQVNPIIYLDDFGNGLESWDSAGSSSTLVDDSSSVMSRKGSQSSLDADAARLNAEYESSHATNSHIAIRPLYAASRQSDPEESSHKAGDMRITMRSRKGHRKSRQGCFNCKRRKIKCQENLPACDNCIRKDLVCKYPPVKTLSQLQVGSVDTGSPLVPAQLQTTPIFTLVDMRLFHHFLFHAYPHLPVGNDAVWVNRVPAVAYQYEYLMHAILGLAASHLTVTADLDYGSLALSHRLLAIKGFNEALSKTPRTGSDGDALLAACYALTFQSSYMPDGMSEFLTMVRGCGLVSLQLRNDNVDVSFSINPTRHLEFMASRLDNLPIIDADLYQGSISSFHALAPLCRGLEAHMAFHKVLQDCVETVGFDSRKGYYKFVLIYHVLGRMKNQQFQMFISPSNDVSRILLAFFVTVEIILAPILGREWQGRVVSTPMEGVLDWLEEINNEVSPGMRSLLSWPNGVARIIRAEMSGDRPSRPWLRAYFRKRPQNLSPV